MLITIKKIKDVKVRDDKGSQVMNPMDSRSGATEESILDESIDVWSIKAVRPFLREKSANKHMGIQEDISVVYFHSNNSRRSPEVHIVAEHIDFVKKVNELRAEAAQRN